MFTNFDFSADYILENERVLLRPIETSDKQHLISFSLQEPAIWRYSLITAGETESNLENYISIAVNNRKAEKEYAFIVFDKHSNNYAGSTRFYDINLEYETLQLGFTWYGSAFQGTGLNRNCKYLLLEFAFEKMKMERVEFRADNNNARSIAAMKAIGCKVDGVLRKNMPNREGGRRDSIVLSILKDEWFGEVKEKLKLKLRE
jgi:RimJ/RimL family protein N-acetyltransferase